MKKRILLIQFRKNDAVAEHEKSCILRAAGVKNANILAKNVFKEGVSVSKKDLSGISKIIIGGSGDFSFSKKSRARNLWIKVKGTMPLVKEAIKKNIPVLGICLGHQYLAALLSAKIVQNKSQQEVGVFKVFLTPDGGADLLFDGLPTSFLVEEGHEDSLKKLPMGVVLLATGNRCKIQAFRYKKAYGVQFHPELNTIEDIKTRIRFSPNYVLGKKKINIQPTPQAKKVLNNFLKM